MKTVVFEDVNGLDFINEFEDIFPLHYEELCVTKEYPYEPNYEAYRNLANAGMAFRISDTKIPTRANNTAQEKNRVSW